MARVAARFPSNDDWRLQQPLPLLVVARPLKHHLNASYLCDLRRSTPSVRVMGNSSKAPEAIAVW